MAPPFHKLPPAAPPPTYSAAAETLNRARRLSQIEQADASTARAEAQAQAQKHAQDLGLQRERSAARRAEARRDRLNERRRRGFLRRWWWTAALWAWVLAVHAAALYFFTSGFLLTRLVLGQQSACEDVPGGWWSGGADEAAGRTAMPGGWDWEGRGTPDGGCWYPRTFKRAVVVLIDALRYDFTVPVAGGNETTAAHYLNAFTALHELAVERPAHAFLRPFIADPPTATLQRLKGLTTGTLPTFMDLGSNFAGTEIDEDNLLTQLRRAGRRIVHLGDDTWHALFPGYFDEERSRPYDSFNVWDLHTVDNGVLEHIFPLLEAGVDGGGDKGWDLLIGHFLGVDHAGHRYGPDHPAMSAKLAQMDDFVRRAVPLLDDDTLLVVMGDHGMDAKGDHGGESDDEVEAALWMYSSRPAFGRTDDKFVVPPATAKSRPVNQIDLVPTLALLLGIPIPFNNLGRPIEEAFATGVGAGSGTDKKGRRAVAWDALAAASRVTAAGIKRYQAAYFEARGVEPAQGPGSPADLWRRAEAADSAAAAAAAATTKTSGRGSAAAASLDWRAVHEAYDAFQQETLRICKGLWARFDVRSMALGIGMAALGVLVLVLYASGDDDDEDDAALDDDDDDGHRGHTAAGLPIVEDLQLDWAEEMLELQQEEQEEERRRRTEKAEAAAHDEKKELVASPPSYQTYNKSIVKMAGLGAVAGLVAGSSISVLLALAAGGRRPAEISHDDVGATAGSDPPPPPLLSAGLWAGVVCAALCSLVSVLWALLLQFGARRSLFSRLVPRTAWSWLAVVLSASQAVGFASNSYTVWEDANTLFLVCTFCACAAAASRNLPDGADRALALYRAGLLAALARLASLSRLCRDEQLPNCVSTYYSSAASSTSGPLQLLVPYAVALLLPGVVRSFLARSRSYEGLAPAWVGYVFRTGLAMAGLYWTLDAADNAGWFDSLALPAGALKAASVYLAQLVLGLACVAGTVGFVYAPPNVIINMAPADPSAGRPRTQVRVLGYANAHGARYLLLPLNVLGAAFVLTKPVGGGALAILLWQVLTLLELLRLLDPVQSPFTDSASALTSSTNPSSLSSSSSGGASVTGPAMLALLGSQAFFSTGHQAVLSSIQWDAAFIPLFHIRYPWSPLAVALNTFAGPIVAASCVPLLALWQAGPRRRGALEAVGKAWAAFVAFHAVQALASMVCAGHLRRHLMLYRVFSPRFMTAAAALLVVDLVGLLVALGGVRSNSLAVGEVFGWAD